MNGIRKSISDWQRILDHLVICTDGEAKNRLLQRLIGRQGSCVLSFVNAHAANLAWRDVTFGNSIISSDVVVRDGIGMRLLLALLGREPGGDLNGTDLIPELLDRLPRDSCLAVYGTQQPYLSAGISRLYSMGFESVHAEEGFHEVAYYVERFAEVQPEVIILAMGMPKQESVALSLKQAAEERNWATLIINGGAIIDFMAYRFPRAPLWMQRLGMEWIYRLIQEPKRLWRRYVVGNVIFVFRALLMFAMHGRLPAREGRD